METCGPSKLQNDDEIRALKGMLDAFGSVSSLKEIASAYCQASKNVDLAGETLSNGQKNPPISTIYELKGRKPSSPNHGSRITSKKMWRPVSVGTVSSVIGKDYVKSATIANGSTKEMKPSGVDLRKSSISAFQKREATSDGKGNDGLHEEIELFLFKMLGDGFQLSRDMIQDVLGSCGYDMKKSMEKLLALSDATKETEEYILGISTAKSTGESPTRESLSFRKGLGCMTSDESSRNSTLNTNEVENRHTKKDKTELEMEVLAALFIGKEEPEEPTRKSSSVEAVKRSKALGYVVIEPPVDSPSEQTANVDPKQDNEQDQDEEDSYQVLRRAVKEYRVTMKEYYKAATDAFSEGDIRRANKLLEQGKFFYRKAREADEESTQKIYETRKGEREDEMSLNLHNYSAKEAIRLLKCHLSSLAGISSIKYLKVIMEKNGEDNSKGARKRMIMKLLEKESIKWIEGEIGTILICLDQINPKDLSFGKK